MDKISIIETVNRFFNAVDDQNWDVVRALFNDVVLLDYTSLLGGEPANLTSDQIIESWKGILTGFDSTHHQLGNYQVETDPNVIHVFCYVTAAHYLKNDSGNNTWTVFGSYNIELREKDRKIRITKLKCNLKHTEGNSELGKIAQERMNKA